MLTTSVLYNSKKLVMIIFSTQSKMSSEPNGCVFQWKYYVDVDDNKVKKKKKKKVHTVWHRIGFWDQGYDFTMMLHVINDFPIV